METRRAARRVLFFPPVCATHHFLLRPPAQKRQSWPRSLSLLSLCACHRPPGAALRDVHASCCHHSLAHPHNARPPTVTARAAVAGRAAGIRAAAPPAPPPAAADAVRACHTLRITSDSCFTNCGRRQRGRPRRRGRAHDGGRRAADTLRRVRRPAASSQP